MVKFGQLSRKESFRILRDNKVIFEGAINERLFLRRPQGTEDRGRGVGRGDSLKRKNFFSPSAAIFGYNYRLPALTFLSFFFLSFFVCFYLSSTYLCLRSGKASALKYFKEDVQTVAHGNECGISFENFDEFEVGDVVECIKKKEEPSSIDDDFEGD